MLQNSELHYLFKKYNVSLDDWMVGTWYYVVKFIGIALNNDLKFVFNYF